MQSDDFLDYDAAANHVRSSIVASPPLMTRPGTAGTRSAFVSSLRSASTSQRRPSSAILEPGQHATYCVKAKATNRLTQISVPTSQDIRSTIFPSSPAPFIESKVHVGFANMQPNIGQQCAEPHGRANGRSVEASTVKFVDICRENNAADMNPDNLTTPFTRCSRAQLKPALPRPGYVIAPAKMKMVVELEKAIADACVSDQSGFIYNEEAIENRKISRSVAFLRVLKKLEQCMPKLETVLSPIVAELQDFFEHQKNNNRLLKERVKALEDKLAAETLGASGVTKSRELVEAEERIEATVAHNLELNAAVIAMKEEMETLKDENRKLVEHSKGLARTATEQHDQLLLFKQGYKSIRDVVKKEASGAQKELSTMKEEIATHYVGREAYDKLQGEASQVLMRAENAEALHVAAMDRCSRLLVDKLRLEKQVSMLKTIILQLRVKCNWTPMANSIFQRTDLNEKSVLREFFAALNKTVKELEQKVFDLENPAEGEPEVNISLMQPHDAPGGPDYFEGLGDDEQIPKFVRTSKRVKNMRLKKYQVEKAIKGIFAARKVSAGSEDIGSFIFSYFKLQIGSDEKSLEWGYSLVYGCETFIDDADCEMFLCIARGQVSETLYMSQLDACAKFEKACEAYDKKRTKNCGKVTAKALRKLIQKFSPTKKVEAIEALVEAAIRDRPEEKGSDFVYASFFAENRNGDQGELKYLQFAEEFRDQFTAERLEYMDEIEHSIRNCVDERYKRGQGPSGFALVSATQALDVIKMLDPKKKPKELLKAMMRAFRVDEGKNVEDAKAIPVSVFMKRVRSVPFPRLSLPASCAPEDGAEEEDDSAGEENDD